ncbi:MAG: hypothetical protein C6I01_04300 [Epsilonproteobacteria bacterium]|nr:hypothetical protein [Campylobacterota bacterium]NPA88650.1 AAA family ATPase [Campylobacterota bacterium]
MGKKIGLGVTSFRELREKGYIYVDKTHLIKELITNYKYALLARPKGFGKTITLSTIEEIFRGNKELFAGTSIYGEYQFEEFPILKLSFRGSCENVDEVREHILEQLIILAEELEPTFRVKLKEKERINYYFADLIKAIYKKSGKQLVILVDNYDNSILENLFDLQRASKIWRIIRDFLLIIKDHGEMIRFAFFTGITGLLRRTPFELSLVEDITLHPFFSNICGFMYEEVVYYFEDYLKNVDMEEVKKWYYGYNFLGDFVFNPIDILSFIKNSYLFKPYWYMTISNEYFYRIVRDHRFFLPEIGHMQAPEKIFNGFNLHSVNVESLAFHTGLITIDTLRETPFGTIFSFRTPNKMVQINLHDDIIRLLTNKSSFFQFKKELYIALKAGDISKFRKVVRQIFATIDPNYFLKYRFDKWSGIHITIMYAYFLSIGADIEIIESSPEEITFVLKLSEKVYLIRISNNNSLKELLRQKYYDTIKARQITLLGLDFDKGDFNFSHIDWEIKERYGQV